MKHFKKLYSLYIDTPSHTHTSHQDTPNTFLSNFSKIIITIAVVLMLSWGITIATTDTFSSATERFSVIGIVSTIDDTSIIITNAQGSDDTGSTEYNIDTTHLDKIETNTYESITLTDITAGDKIIIQGKTTGSVYFATRLILFPSSPFDILPETATSTDPFATSTDVTASSTDATGDINASSTDTTGDTTASSTDSQTEGGANGGTDDSASSSTDTIPSDATSSNQTSSPTNQDQAPDTSTTDSTTTTVIDTISDIIDSGINAVSNTIGTIINTITGDEEEPAPTTPDQTEEQLTTPTEDTTPSPEPTSEPTPPAPEPTPVTEPTI